MNSEKNKNQGKSWMEITLRMFLFFAVLFLYGERLFIGILRHFELLNEENLLIAKSALALFVLALTRLGMKFTNKKWRKFSSSILITLLFIYFLYFIWLRAWPSLVQN